MSGRIKGDGVEGVGKRLGVRNGFEDLLVNRSVLWIFMLEMKGWISGMGCNEIIWVVRRMWVEAKWEKR